MNTEKLILIEDPPWIDEEKRSRFYQRQAQQQLDRWNAVLPSGEILLGVVGLILVALILSL